MKIIVENHIPFIQGRLETEFDEVIYLPASQITGETVADANALLVRTRTLCNADLLQDSSVEFIGTATIGTDHIDRTFCRRHGITVASAPGCNAPAVAQWVFASIGTWLSKTGERPEGLTIGIVGVGHVGSIVERWARQLGFNVLINDPPRQQDEGGDCWSSLNEVAEQSDIITVHTPLTAGSPHPTVHLIDKNLLNRLDANRKHLVLNAARGEIADTHALLAAKPDIDFAIDCWENEPLINRDLLNRSIIATPHIAGYSLEGKKRGTAMILKALNEYFGTNVSTPQVDAPINGAHDVTFDKILRSYSPEADTARLKSQPVLFEHLRNNYDLRNEV